MIKRLFMVVLLAGCSSDSFETTRRAIEGGEESNFGAVVGIRNNAEDRTCTGTLIAPNLILTARHCVSEITATSGVCGTPFFGPSLDVENILITFESQMPFEDEAYNTIAEIYAPPTGDICGDDVAIIRLADAVETPYIAPNLETEPSLGTTYTAFGFGARADGTGTSTRRERSELSVRCGGETGCLFPNEVGPTEFMGGGGTCNGDSGGPAIDEDGDVVGVFSRGDETCTISVYAGLKIHADWIRDVAQANAMLNDVELPIWVDGDFDEDRVGDGIDNCPEVENLAQIDSDSDGIGDACEPDVVEDEEPIKDINEQDEPEQNTPIEIDEDRSTNGGCGVAGWKPAVPGWLLLIVCFCLRRNRARHVLS